MLKTGKKVLSLILALCLMCSMFSVSAFAASDKTDNSRDIQTNICDDMDVKSTNSFGALLTSELEQESDKQEANNGINIFSVEVTGKTATAEFETLQDSTLVVAIYDESGVEMLASGSTDVTSEDTTAEVTIDIEAMPTYFYLKAFLVDKEVYRPLCTAYESPNYTQEMQEFFAKTTDDFDSDKVLNLDSDETNNFAVYDDGTKVIEQNGSNNQVTGIDDQSKKYIIENADSSITSLKEGDIFAYNYSTDETLIVKVKSISVIGTTATIYGDEVAIDEVFEYVKIDETADLSNADVDPSTCDEGVTYEGMNREETVNSKEIIPSGAEFEGSSKVELNYNLCRYSANNEDGQDNGYPKIDFKGSLKLGLEGKLKFYLTSSQQYIEFSLGYSLKMDFSITSQFPIKNIRLTKIVIPLLMGLDISIVPSFVIESKITLQLVAELSGSTGIRSNFGGGIEDISKSPRVKSELKAKGTLFVGISMEPQLEIFCGLASAGLEARVGAEIEADMNIADSENHLSDSVIHMCGLCLDGEIRGKFSLSADVKFFYSDNLKMSINLLEFKWKICDFYYSYDYGTFAFTTCPYNKYKVTVSVRDVCGLPVNGALVNDKYTTDSSGKAEFYLTGGNHTITAEQDNISGSASVSIDGEPTSVIIVLNGLITDDELNQGSEEADRIIFKDISIYLHNSAAITENGDLYVWGSGILGDGTTASKNIPTKIMSNIKYISIGDGHSGAITENGDLYMWGLNIHGQIGDGTTSRRYTPTKIMSNVKSISIGDTHSGAITENGDLYMWGYNRHGQLGDGTTSIRYTPTKIMSNVKSVSLGYQYSAAITENGDLYMWGNNSLGEFGNGTTIDSNIPIKVMSNIKSVELGSSYASRRGTNNSAAITQNGDLYMWGAGLLGDGTENSKYTPIKIMSNIKSVSLADYQNSAAITENGDLYMWGYNSHGWIGDGTTSTRYTPTKIMSHVKSVSLGDCYSGAITENGDLYMWGNNDSGQLGDGTTTARYTPTKITIPASNTSSVSLGLIDSGSASSDCKTETFTDLLPNEVYNFYSMKTQNAKNPFGSANLLYIAQATTDDNGNLSVTYIPDEDYDNAVNFVVPLKQTDLSTAEVTMDNLLFSGETQYVTPVVTLDGKILVEGEDYDLHGGYFAKDSGNYTLIIKGRGLFTGEIVFNYMILSSEKISGDVNGDGVISVADAIFLQKYLADIVDFDNEQLAAADTNGDGSVSIADAIQIQKYLANIVTSLG